MLTAGLLAGRMVIVVWTATTKSGASNQWGKPMSENRRAIGSDLAKVYAHVIQREEYDGAPELTDEMFDRAEIRIGDKVIRPGRPPLPSPKVQTTLRLDQDVVAHFRAGGPGWQSRINAALREAMTPKKAAG